MPRSQPTTLETLLGRDPYNIIDVRGGGIFDDPDEEPEEDDVDARMRSGMQKAVAMMRGVGSKARRSTLWRRSPMILQRKRRN